MVGVFASNSGYSIIDPVIGLIIGLFVLKTAYTIGKENIDNIMGKIPSKELIKILKKQLPKLLRYWEHIILKWNIWGLIPLFHCILNLMKT